jgi:hypothetical protein
MKKSHCSYEVYDHHLKKTRTCKGRLYAYCYKHGDYVCGVHYSIPANQFVSGEHKLTRNIHKVKMRKKLKRRIVKIIVTIPLLTSFGYSVNKH